VNSGQVFRPDEIVVFGKIVAPYGLRGAIKVHPFVDDPEAWARLPEWRLGKEGSGEWWQIRVVRCRTRGSMLLAELEGMTNRNASESVCGMLVGAPRDGLPPTEDNEFYWADLIGLAVENLQGQPLGQVHGLIETPANDVLRVVDAAGKERLLPFVAAVVLEVDRSARCIRADWNLDW
jgi:16S rRNA processing protein RimM